MKRCKRRRMEQIIYKRRLSSWLCMGYKMDDIAKWHWLKHTGKPCSCSVCCNPRRSKWNKGNRRTIQEKIFNMKLWEELSELRLAK